MWRLPLNALRAFAAVYRTGGLRSAARELDVAHSAIIRHVAELETWLGVPLTNRGMGRRRLEFTPQGRALGEKALLCIRDLTTTVSSIREARTEASVQIGAPPSFAIRWLLPRLPELETAHPGIEVSVIVDRKLENIEGTDLDAAIIMSSRRPRDVESMHLMSDELYPVMSRGYWSRHGRPSTPRDLLRLRLLHDRDPGASWSQWQTVHGPAELDVRKGPRYTSTDLVLRAAGAGQGVALARHQLVLGDLSSGHLVRPLGDLSVQVKHAYWILLPGHKQPSAASRTVVHWLASQARDTARPNPIA